MMGSLRLGVRGEVGIGGEREGKYLERVAKSYLFLFTWNRPFSIPEKGIRFGVQLYCLGENGKSGSLEVVRS